MINTLKHRYNINMMTTNVFSWISEPHYIENESSRNPKSEVIFNYHDITDLKGSLMNWSNLINCNIGVQAMSNKKLTFP